MSGRRFAWSRISLGAYWLILIIAHRPHGPRKICHLMVCTMTILNLPLDNDRRSHGKAPFIGLAPADVIDARIQAYKQAAALNKFSEDEVWEIFETARTNAARRTLTRA